MPSSPWCTIPLNPSQKRLLSCFLWGTCHGDEKLTNLSFILALPCASHVTGHAALASASLPFSQPHWNDGITWMASVTLPGTVSKRTMRPSLCEMLYCYCQDENQQVISNPCSTVCDRPLSFQSSQVFQLILLSVARHFYPQAQVCY